MSVRILSSADDLQAYNAFVAGHPQGSLWQSVARKRYVEACGKQTRIYRSGKWKVESEIPEATALVVIDRTTGGFSTWEIPRGPLWTSEEAAHELMKEIVADAKKDNCIALYLSPPSSLSTFHFQLSTRRVHAQATRIIDLTKTEEEILAQMHPKGRYNITVASRNGIVVREGSESDIGAFYELLKSTGGRDGFKILQKSHYTRFLSALEESFFLLAEHQGKPVAGLIGVIWNGTGIYYYGASSYEHRNLMAPYLLQWETMKRCKEKGCTSYDLLGISPENASANDPWQGITEFKRKFGGTVVTYPHEQMIVLRPVMQWSLSLKRRFFG